MSESTPADPPRPPSPVLPSNAYRKRRYLRAESGILEARLTSRHHQTPYWIRKWRKYSGTTADLGESALECIIGAEKALDSVWRPLQNGQALLLATGQTQAQQQQPSPLHTTPSSSSFPPVLPPKDSGGLPPNAFVDDDLHDLIDRPDELSLPRTYSFPWISPLLPKSSQLIQANDLGDERKGMGDDAAVKEAEEQYKEFSGFCREVRAAYRAVLREVAPELESLIEVPENEASATPRWSRRRSSARRHPKDSSTTTGMAQDVDALSRHVETMTPSMLPSLPAEHLRTLLPKAIMHQRYFEVVTLKSLALFLAGCYAECHETLTVELGLDEFVTRNDVKHRGIERQRDTAEKGELKLTGHGVVYFVTAMTLKGMCRELLTPLRPPSAAIEERMSHADPVPARLEPDKRQAYLEAIACYRTVLAVLPQERASGSLEGGEAGASVVAHVGDGNARLPVTASEVPKGTWKSFKFLLMVEEALYRGAMCSLQLWLELHSPTDAISGASSSSRPSSFSPETRPVLQESDAYSVLFASLKPFLGQTLIIAAFFRTYLGHIPRVFPGLTFRPFRRLGLAKWYVRFLVRWRRMMLGCQGIESLLKDRVGKSSEAAATGDWKSDNEGGHMDDSLDPSRVGESNQSQDSADLPTVIIHDSESRRPQPSSPSSVAEPALPSELTLADVFPAFDEIDTILSAWFTWATKVTGFPRAGPKPAAKRKVVQNVMRKMATLKKRQSKEKMPHERRKSQESVEMPGSPTSRGGPGSATGSGPGPENRPATGISAAPLERPAVTQSVVIGNRRIHEFVHTLMFTLERGTDERRLRHDVFYRGPRSGKAVPSADVVSGAFQDSSKNRPSISQSYVTLTWFQVVSYYLETRCHSSSSSRHFSEDRLAELSRFPRVLTFLNGSLHHTFHSLCIMRYLFEFYLLFLYRPAYSLNILRRYIDLARERFQLHASLGDVAVLYDENDFEDDDSLMTFVDTVVVGCKALCRKLGNVRASLDIARVAKDQIATVKAYMIEKYNNASSGPSDIRNVPSHLRIWVSKTNRLVGSIYLFASRFAIHYNIKRQYQAYAVSLFEEALKWNPRSWRLLYLLALVKAEKKDISQALGFAKRSVKLHQHHVEAWHLMVLLLTELKNYEGAVRLCELAVKECAAVYLVPSGTDVSASTAAADQERGREDGEEGEGEGLLGISRTEESSSSGISRFQRNISTDSLRGLLGVQIEHFMRSALGARKLSGASAASNYTRSNSARPGTARSCVPPKAASVDLNQPTDCDRRILKRQTTAHNTFSDLLNLLRREKWKRYGAEGLDGGEELWYGMGASLLLIEGRQPASPSIGVKRMSENNCKALQVLFDPSKVTVECLFQLFRLRITQTRIVQRVSGVLASAQICQELFQWFHACFGVRGAANQTAENAGWLMGGRKGVIFCTEADMLEFADRLLRLMEKVDGESRPARAQRATQPNSQDAPPLHPAFEYLRCIYALPGWSDIPSRLWVLIWLRSVELVQAAGLESKALELLHALESALLCDVPLPLTTPHSLAAYCANQKPGLSAGQSLGVEEWIQAYHDEDDIEGATTECGNGALNGMAAACDSVDDVVWQPPLPSGRHRDLFHDRSHRSVPWDEERHPGALGGVSPTQLSHWFRSRVSPPSSPGHAILTLGAHSTYSRPQDSALPDYFKPNSACATEVSETHHQTTSVDPGCETGTASQASRHRRWSRQGLYPYKHFGLQDRRSSDSGVVPGRGRWVGKQSIPGPGKIMQPQGVSPPNGLSGAPDGEPGSLVATTVKLDRPGSAIPPTRPSTAPHSSSFESREGASRSNSRTANGSLTYPYTTSAQGTTILSSVIGTFPRSSTDGTMLAESSDNRVLHLHSLIDLWVLVGSILLSQRLPSEAWKSFHRCYHILKMESIEAQVDFDADIQDAGNCNGPDDNRGYGYGPHLVAPHERSGQTRYQMGGCSKLGVLPFVGYAEVLMGLAKANFVAGDLVSAEALLKDLLNVYVTDSTEAWYYLGLIHKEKGEYEKVKECMLFALESERTEPVQRLDILPVI